MQTFLRRAFVVGSFAFTVPCSAQCMEWDTKFYSFGTNDEVSAAVTFDDGSGPALYLGGEFITAGTVAKPYVARWDGTTWTSLGSGMNGAVRDLAVFDDGSGPAVYAGGEFTTAGGVGANAIAKWNGTTWSPLGSGLEGGSPATVVHALAVFDDGTGAALYAGGVFVVAGGVSVSRIAKWDGSSWSAVTSGTDLYVGSLAVHDDGTGPALYVGGVFVVAGGVSASRIAKWNGTSWSALGTGMTGNQSDTQVMALASFDDGTGPALFAGGRFTTAGGVSASCIAKWNGSSWAALGSGVDTYVYALTVFDDGTGPALFAGGGFSTAGGSTAKQIAKWNGTAWSELATGMTPHRNTQATVRALVVFDDGTEPALHAGGFFKSAGGQLALNVAKWNGSSWARIGVPGMGLVGWVRAFARFDDGSGEALYAGGTFENAGGISVSNIAKWDGAQWSALGSGVSTTSTQDYVYALAVFDDGNGPALYAGGDFTMAGGASAVHVAKWNGTSWSALGSGTNRTHVYALCVFDDGTGPALYVGGDFDVAGGVSASRIAKWNGSSWSALGSGVTAAGSCEVNALVAYDDGTGPALYAGGDFRQAGGFTAWCIARWNGTSWSPFGNGVTAGIVYSFATFDYGAGTQLYAGGEFFSLAGVPASDIAKWNGSNWSAVGAYPGSNVLSLCAFDDGSAPKLYAGGQYSGQVGQPAHALATWDGATWDFAAGNVNAIIYALAEFDDGADGTADLYVGGRCDIADINSANPKPSFGIAELHGCEHDGNAYCFGDGLDAVVTAQCPCANFGDPGHGCENSIFASGARLSASGTTNPNTIVFEMTNAPNNTLATGFANTTNTNPGGVVFGDGVRCQSGTLVRFGSHNTGTLGDAPTTWTAPAFSISPGLTRYYQVQYRNSAPAFCPPETFNISNGYRISW